MKKTLFVTIFIILFLAFTGCTAGAATHPPLNDAGKIATNAAGTLAAFSSSTSVAPIPAGANMQTYADPDFGFKLQYDTSWLLEVKPGSGMMYYDGRGRTIWLSKDGYIFQLAVIGGPGNVQDCAGIFHQNPTAHYWVYMVDNIELWRIKAEQGEINAYSTNELSSVNIISPLELYEEPKINEYTTSWGSYTCQPQFSNHGVLINYILPVSLAELQAGNFSQERLTELDNILVSLTWK